MRIVLKKGLNLFFWVLYPCSSLLSYKNKDFYKIKSLMISTIIVINNDNRIPVKSIIDASIMEGHL